MNLQNKKILITGGSSGIGKATAKLLVEAGATVAITGRNAEKLEQVAKEIGAVPVAFNMSDYNVLEGKAKETVDALGGIDVLINNAGIGEFALLEDVKVEMFEKVFATNVFGLAMLTQAFVKYFKEQNHGNIINIASTASQKGFAYGTVYSASKFALRSMTECWRTELRKFNIRVIQINPSEVTTAFGNTDREERAEESKKLRPIEIAHSIKAALEMDARGFIPELTVWATNP